MGTGLSFGIFSQKHPDLLWGCSARARFYPGPATLYSVCPSCPHWHHGASWRGPGRELCPKTELCWGPRRRGQNPRDWAKDSWSSVPKRQSSPWGWRCHSQGLPYRLRHLPPVSSGSESTAGALFPEGSVLWSICTLVVHL